MTYTWDPRPTIYDNPDTLERSLIEAAQIPVKPTVQQAHINNIAKLKGDLAALEHKCADCGLLLARESKAIYCVSCGAQRKLNWRKKVHSAFVRKTPGLLPKPEMP